MERETKGIRYQSEHFKTVQGLMHYVNEQTLMEQHLKQPAQKAKGIDNVDKNAYDEHVRENIDALLERMKSFQYKPLPVKRAYIPKANGKLRPLGIPAYEDRLVQGAMAAILNEVYEPRFLDCSYGFRPGRSAHDAVAYINNIIMHGKVNCVLEADIKGFFDNVDHSWIMKFLEHDIEDKNFLRYIKRFLIAGVMEGTEFTDSDKGTPQGGQISPVLANVYLHYVLDLWFMHQVKRTLQGEAYYVRYADDFLVMFQYERDARRVMEELKERLNKFSLELAEDKTRILPFGRYKGTRDSFDFLGFTFGNAKTRNGYYSVSIRTSAKKLKAKRVEIKKWLRTRLTEPLEETFSLLKAKLIGHYNYYGVSGNYKSLYKFYKYVLGRTFKMINRRSQRKSMTYEKFLRKWNFHIPKPHITHQIWGVLPKTV